MWGQPPPAVRRSKAPLALRPKGPRPHSTFTAQRLKSSARRASLSARQMTNLTLTRSTISALRSLLESYCCSCPACP